MITQAATGTSQWVATSAEYRPDRYYTYGHLTELLKNWAASYPDLVTLESIGTSLEGRDIWVVTLTNQKTGEHAEKPATYVDANIHAGEVTGCASVLWLLNHLLTGYGSDDHITRLLDDTVLYAIPAIMVDGMDLYLTSSERLRSSVRLYPEQEPQEGLRREDLDGDGRILQMRIRDENGPWKPAPEDNRVMIRRGPDEFGGDYYFVLEEGLIKDWDGGAITLAAEHYGLDLNRNFPYKWGSEHEQTGAGVLPLSEPETRALAEFLVDHPNISMTQHFHTWSAVILRASAFKSDDDLNASDLRAYKAIGKMGEEETGYKCVSIHDGFAYDKKQAIMGSLIDWMYETLGAYPFATELWSLPRRAGIEIDDIMEWRKDYPYTDDLKMAKMLDEEVDGAGIYAFTPFDHPQLGQIEIGGWDYKFAWQNPPAKLLEEVTAPNAKFVVREMGVVPRIVFREVKTTPLGSGIARIEAIIQNVGFLPTNVSEAAKANKAFKPVRVSITPGSDVEVVSGKLEQELGHLEGRSNAYGPFSVPPRYDDRTRSKAEWVVKAAGGSTVELVATSTKAGTVREKITIPEHQG